MKMVEQAVDMNRMEIEKKGYTKLTIKSIAIESVYCDLHRTAADIALLYNVLEPMLGDRVVNLSASSVPFGLRGTVVTIHPATQYVEVKGFCECIFYAIS